MAASVAHREKEGERERGHEREKEGNEERGKEMGDEGGGEREKEKKCTYECE